MLEIGNSELAERPINRRPETQARVIRFADRTPAAVRPINSNHVIVVTHRLQIQDQRRPAGEPQRRGSEERTLEAMRGVVTDNEARRITGFALLLFVVRQIIQILLNFFRSGEIT